MDHSIRNLMTPDPMVLPAHASLTEAAEAMKERDIGDVVVTDDGGICGIVTDRDIVVRAIAEHRPADETTLREICSKELVTVSPADTTDLAARLMREQALRRLVVSEKGKPVGIVSLGDLARDLDGDSVLGDISSAPANR